MSQALLLVDVLKQALRAAGLTYADVARGIGLSESSVKRLFATRNLDLHRLEQICGLMDLEIADLLESTRTAEGRITELTEEQERILVNDPKLLLIGVLAISHWTVADMLQVYQITESELVARLAQLDKLKVIDLLTGNRIKVRLARNFAWRKAGPIQQFFEQRVQQQFFQSSFLGRGELRLMVNGGISAQSNQLLQQRLQKVAEEFDSLVEQDRRLDRTLREGTTLVMALRPWELGLFTELRRRPEDHDQPRDVRRGP
jgi:transcriptional regulator with XRE-family HTH domain